MACSCTGKWSAFLNTQPIGPHTLTVRGQAKCEDGSADPSLRKAIPQGIVAQELLLELVWQEVAESTGEPEPVEYRESPSPTYNTVRIVNCDIDSIKVEIVT